MRLFVLPLAVLAACSSKKQDEQRPPDPRDPPPVGALVIGDAGVTAVVIGVDPSVDPGTMHMDDDVSGRPTQVAPQPNRPGRPIDVTLRSTPPGATVAVDGAVIGTTPAFWNGMADGREHEFVFTMRSHAIARYRFVPVASGVIHGRLDRIHEETDAGVQAPPPEVVPPHAQTTPSVNPPTAPPTITNGAAVVPPAGPGSSAAPVGPQP